MRKFVCALAAAGLATAGLAATDAQAEEESYNFIFVHHAAPGHQFWEIEKNGMEEACALINADCQMVFLQTQDGNIGEVLQNLEAAVEQQPDGIATTIMGPRGLRRHDPARHGHGHSRGLLQRRRRGRRGG